MILNNSIKWKYKHGNIILIYLSNEHNNSSYEHNNITN